MFIIGHIRDDNAQEEAFKQVGTVIVKGTFQNIKQPKVASAEKQVAIFVKDHPYNAVRNSDFEREGSIEPWQVFGAEAKLAANWGVGAEDNPTALWIKSDGGADIVQQTLSFDEPLGGRTFVLSFYAQAKTEVTIDGFSLQIKGADQQICRMSAVVPQLPPLDPPVMNYQRFVSQPETWPAAESSTEMEVVLPGSADPDNPVYFDRVQVEETALATRWNENSVYRYEHDLAPFKPYADIIVLQPVTPASSQPEWTVFLELDTGQSVKKNYDDTAWLDSGDPAPTVKNLFGWEGRGDFDSPRKERAGKNLGSFNPDERVMPEEFQNEFFNGYGWDEDENKSPVRLAHLADNTVLTISSDPTSFTSFQVRLPAARPTAIRQINRRNGNTDERPLPLKLDTIIIEPQLDRYQVIWRGMWEWDDQADPPVALRVTGGIP